MHRLPRHSAYKDSGLPWVDEIPSHWQTRRNRFLFREVDSRSVHGVETHLSMSQVHGLVPSKSLNRKSLQSENYVGGKLVSGNDLVLNRLKAHLGVFATAKQAGVVSPDYSVFRPKGDASVQYCEALFKTSMYVAEFRRRTKGIVEGFWRLYTDDFYDVPALLPPQDEQDQIVSYLLVQDNNIAKLIKAKRALIALLNEQKLRIIDHAVTRGLDVSVALKPSGIKWLGDVPEHWDAQKLKFVTKRIVGGSTPKSDEPSNWGGDVVWATPKDVSKTDLLTCSLRTITRVGLRSCSTTLVPAGSIVITSRAPVGNVAIAGVELCTNQGCKAIVPATGIMISDYLFLLLLRMKERLQVLANGTTFAEIGTSVLANEFVPLPPVTEQLTICRWIESECKPVNEAIARAEEEIRLIREYRDRQIADVVTGQVDVRGWVPAPDDIVADEDLAVLGGGEELDTDEEEDDGDN